MPDHPRSQPRQPWRRIIGAATGLAALALALAVALSACASTTPSATLAAPAGVWLQEHDRAITVHWTPVPDAQVTGYRLLMAPAEDGENALEAIATVTGGSTAEHELTGLTNLAAYRIAVLATGEGGLRSDPSTPVLGAPFSVASTPIANIEFDGDAGTAVLSDGQRFVLHSEAELRMVEASIPGRTDALTSASLGPAALPSAGSLPATFTLAAFQTGIRNQQGRGTCQTFAALAAMEAKYKHLGFGDRDLSEQYASHITRIVRLDKTPGVTAAVHENTLGTQSGWNSGVVLGRLARYGVPLENVAPYLGQADYGDTNQAGDVPRIDPKDATVSQRVYNDFNLQDEPTTYSIPATITTTTFPREALTAAPYGVTGFHFAPADRFNDPTWYEQTLVAGNEIAFGFCFRGGKSDENKIWRLGAKPAKAEDDKCGGHQVLLIGYDRSDPDDPVFIAKNSWGGTAYQKLEYAFVTDTRGVNQAVVVDGVRDPNRTDARSQVALGRWDLVADGTTGTLDITRLSGFYAASDLDGQVDRRLGVFFDEAGDPFRVNGSVDPVTLTTDFHIDFSNPALDYETLSGAGFTGTIPRHDTTFMAGRFEPAGGGTSRGFYARKDGPYVSVPGGSTVVAPTFEGRWSVHGLEADSVVVIDSVLSTGVFSGRYAHTKGDPATGVANGPISGAIDLSTREVRFNMPDDSSVGGAFLGSVHSGDLGTISGSYTRGSKPGGLALIREGDVQNVTIEQVGSLRQDGAVMLRATAADFVDLADVTIRWSYQTSPSGPSTSLGSSASGAIFSATVPCSQLLVTAEAVDATRGLSATDVRPVSCQQQVETRRFHIDRGLSGWVNDNAKLGTAAQGSTLYVGDDAFDNAYRSLLTFPSLLPDELTKITKAEVTLSLDSVDGDPYTTLLELRAFQVDYGSSLDAADFTPVYLPGAATLPFDGTTTFGTMTFDMTEAMKDAWANRATRGDRLQMILQFRTATDSDGIADRATFDAQDRPGTTLLPFIDITFENY